ncbi:MAG: hypothetical protein D3909_08080, partial [Candidatus Electrothrix sp. ATG1]|nr:hypothetical protein [Candidatus Electrothrix sp. ATG1]
MKKLFYQLSFCCLSAGVLAIGPVADLQADVVLDPPNLMGTVGLTDETFGSAQIHASWDGGEVETNLSGSDTDFAIRVEPGKKTNLRVRMYSFQDSSNARVDQYVNGIGAIGEGEKRNLGLVSDAGRIHGSINVVSGSVKNIHMISSVQQEGLEEYTEQYNGFVSMSAQPVEALQPMPALPNTRVYGHATLIADAGCDVPVNLVSQYVTVPNGDTVNVTWDFDLSDKKCSGIEGEVSLPGLDGDNADVSLNRHYIYASQGNASFNEQLTEDGNYIFPSVTGGIYGINLRSYFNPPYGYLQFRHETASVTEGDITTHDFLKPVGTLHGSVVLNGLWGLSDVSLMNARFQQNTGWSSYPEFYDQVDLTSGAFDIVAPIGTGYLHYIQPYFYENDGAGGYVSEHYWRYYDTEEQSPIQVTVAEGDRLEGYTVELKTSQADVGVHLPDPDVSIKQLRITSNDEVHDPITDALLGRREIKLSSNLTTPCNGMIIPIRGESGVYNMTAVADGDDGGTYSKAFILELISPEYTAIGHALRVDFADDAELTIGSVTFDNV